MVLSKGDKIRDKNVVVGQSKVWKIDDGRRSGTRMDRAGAGARDKRG